MTESVIQTQTKKLQITRILIRDNEINNKLNYKSYTTNIIDPDTDILRIPIWLLDVDDLALLLDATTPTQLPIIEKTLKLVPILTGSSENVIKRKNDIRNNKSYIRNT